MQLFDEIRKLCTNIREEKKVSYSKINSITQKFKDEWIRIMAYSGLYNKMHKTYSLNNIEFKSFGIRCDIYIVAPLTYDTLEKNLDMLQENLDCLIVFNHKKARKWINVRFIYNECDTKQFEVIP